MSNLSDEYTNDPLGRGYAAMHSKDVAADMHLVIRPGPVAAQDQRMWLAQEGRHEKLAQGVLSGADDTVKGLCRSALLMATNDDEYRREDHLPLLNALVTASVLTQTDADALDGQCDNQRSRVSEKSLGRVAEGTIDELRRSL